MTDKGMNDLDLTLYTDYPEFEHEYANIQVTGRLGPEYQDASSRSVARDHVSRPRVRATDQIPGCSEGEDNAVFGVTCRIAVGVDSHPIVLDDAVIAEKM